MYFGQNPIESAIWNIFETIAVCTIKEKLCAEIAELEYLTPATDEEEEEELARTCGCFPPCHDTHYEATLSTSSIAETSTRVNPYKYIQVSMSVCTVKCLAFGKALSGI